jgi:hypothetical protein
MHRLYAGFLFAPLIVTVVTCILSGGVGIVLFLPMLMFAYVFTLVVAVPLFFICRKLRWLRWWHAAAAGAFVGGMLALLFVSGGNPYHFEINGYGQVLPFLAIGFFIGAVFWVIAIFQNEAFSNVPSRFPIQLLITGILLLAFTLLLPAAYRITYTQGEVTAVLPSVQGKPMLQVKLKSGASVSVRAYCYGQYLSGRKVFVAHRTKFLFVTEGYWVEGLSDIKSPEDVLNECSDAKAPPVGRLYLDLEPSSKGS